MGRKLKLNALVFLFSLGFFLFFCCGSKHQTLPWNREDFVGHRFRLNSRSYFEFFQFLDDGKVIVTFGMKGGPLAGPVLDWELSLEGALVIDFGEGEKPIILEKVSTGQGSVEVLRNGKLVQYERSE